MIVRRATRCATRCRTVFVALVASAFASCVGAQERADLPSHMGGDPQALSVGLPVRIQDALVVPFGEVDLQTYNNSTFGTGGNRTVSSPVSEIFKVGLAPGFSANVGLGRNLANASAGDTIHPSFQYVITDNGPILPAVSMEGSYSPASTNGGAPEQAGASAQVTKFLGPSKQDPRLHFNFEWVHQFGRLQGDRENTFSGGVGVSALVDARTAVVGDVFFEQSPERGRSRTYLDIGVVQDVGNGTALSIGAGTGLNASAPTYRLYLSLSKFFRFFD